MAETCTYTIQTKIHSKNQKKTFNILIVDDDNNIADILKNLLCSRGHHVFTVNEGIDCISKCCDIQYDIVFIDYHMENLDGAQVADIIRDKLKKSIIFAFTGDNSEKATSKFKKVGMNGVVIKPITVPCIDMLMNKLENSIIFDKQTILALSQKSQRSIIIFD